MNNEMQIVDFNHFVNDLHAKQAEKPKLAVYRFDLFRGEKDAEGKVTKIKAVGNAYLREGFRTYTVHVKSLLKDVFYLLPNNKEGEKNDFVILTREPAQNSGRKYFWNNVGGGKILDGLNSGLMVLNWDFFGNEIYMNLYPTNVAETPEATKADVAA